MPVLIRKLAPEEIAALTPDTFTLVPIFNRLSTYAGLQGSILVAEVDGTLAGCAALAYGGEARDGGALHVEHFAILPAFRGHGVGFKLMKAVLDEARRFNALSVRAEIPALVPRLASLLQPLRLRPHRS